MNKKYLLLLLAVPAFWACTSVRELEVDRHFANEKQPADLSEEMVISASLETSGTKTSLSGSSVFWTEGDQIKLFNSTNPEGVVFTLTNGAGTKHGKFTGAAVSGSGPFYAVYPASSASELSGSTVSVTLPQVQVLTQDSFGNGANLSMAVGDTAEDNFTFKNAMGAVSFALNGTPSIKSIRIQTKGSEPLCGAGQLSMSGDTPALTLSGTEVETQVVYLSGSAQNGPFYLILPPGALTSGFMVEFEDAEDMVMVKSAGATADNMVKRNEILAMPAFDFEQQIKSAFLNQPSTGFGYFEKTGTSGSLSAFAFDKVSCQYATKTEEATSRYMRIQSLPLGKYFAFTTPYELNLGASYDDIAIESVVGSSYTSTTATFRVIRKASDAAWLVSSDFQKGFILLLED